MARYALENPVRSVKIPITRDAQNQTAYGKCSFPSRRRKENRVATD